MGCVFGSPSTLAAAAPPDLSGLPTAQQQQPDERAHAPTAKQAKAAAKALRIITKVVAKANALAPDERPKDKHGRWSRFGGAWLEPLLEHTTLIDARYLLALADAGGIVPRWQELPEAARITPANVWRLKAAAGFQLPVLVLSYPWLDKDHPDRMGETLRRVAPVLRAWLADVSEC